MYKCIQIPYNYQPMLQHWKNSFIVVQSEIKNRDMHVTSAQTTETLIWEQLLQQRAISNLLFSS